jgi:hypothetical protein
MVFCYVNSSPYKKEKREKNVPCSIKHTVPWSIKKIIESRNFYSEKALEGRSLRFYLFQIQKFRIQIKSNMCLPWRCSIHVARGKYNNYG